MGLLAGPSALVPDQAAFAEVPSEPLLEVGHIPEGRPADPEVVETAEVRSDIHLELPELLEVPGSQMGKPEVLVVVRHP